MCHIRWRSKPVILLFYKWNNFKKIFFFKKYIYIKSGGNRFKEINQVGPRELGKCNPFIQFGEAGFIREFLSKRRRWEDLIAFSATAKNGSSVALPPLSPTPVPFTKPFLQSHFLPRKPLNQSQTARSPPRNGSSRGESWGPKGVCIHGGRRRCWRHGWVP